MSEQHKGSQPSETGREQSRAMEVIDCATAEDLAEPFVLRSLEADEQAAVEAHARFCRRCADRVASARQTVSMLAFSVPPATPPPSAKASLFARIEQASAPPPESYMNAASLNSMRTPTLPASDPAGAPAPAPRSQPVDRPRSRLAAYALPLATLPLLLALGIVGYWGVNNRMQLNDQTSQVEDMATQIQYLNSEVLTLNQTFDKLDQYLGVGQAKQYAMVPQTNSGETDAFGRIIANPVADQAMVMVWRLDEEPATYDIMVELPNGEVYDAGDLDVNGSGSALMNVDLGRPVTDIKSIHIQPKVSDTVTDAMALKSGPDVLYALIGPDLGEVADTGPQRP